MRRGRLKRRSAGFSRHHRKNARIEARAPNWRQAELLRSQQQALAVFWPESATALWRSTAIGIMFTSTTKPRGKLNKSAPDMIRQVHLGLLFRAWLETHFQTELQRLHGGPDAGTCGNAGPAEWPLVSGAARIPSPNGISIYSVDITDEKEQEAGPHQGWASIVESSQGRHRR